MSEGAFPELVHYDNHQRKFCVWRTGKSYSSLLDATVAAYCDAGVRERTAAIAKAMDCIKQVRAGVSYREQDNANPDISTQLIANELASIEDEDVHP